MNIEGIIPEIQIINDLEDAEQQAENANRRMIRRENAFELSDFQFVRLFRLSKELTRYVVQLVSPFVQPPSRQSAMSIETKVLVTLLFVGHGSYQRITGNNVFTGLSQPSVSRSIYEVTTAFNMANIMNQWVKFPQNIQELQDLRNRLTLKYDWMYAHGTARYVNNKKSERVGFYRRHNFPGVIGCIDCTHVAIVPPKDEEHIYVNRKNYHSINVQLICDENLTILNVNSRYPGSCHDAYIWNQSNVSQLLERIYRNDNNNLFFLLGDSGYPLRPWLLTPLQGPAPNTPEERMNNRLKSVRSIIERCNGVLKNRFRCLLKHRVLHYAPETASRIVNACVILHNMCIAHNIPEPEVDEDLQQADFGININDVHIDEPVARVNVDLATARRIQQNIVNNHFNE